MNKLRITIVSYNWPPRNAIGTHRPYSWARYWAQLGAQVTIITAQKYHFDAPLDLSLPDLEHVVVHEIPYMGLSGTGASIFRNSTLRSLARRLKRTFARTTGYDIDLRAKWIEAVRPLARKLAHESDVVVSTFGPASSHMIASEMKQCSPNLWWVADYRDLWSQNHLVKMTPSKRQRVKDLELVTVGRFADTLTTVSSNLAEQLHGLLDLDAAVVYNGFDISELDLLRNLKRPIKKIRRPFRIVYTGMIYRGFRDPVPLLESIVRMVEKGCISPGEIVVDFYGTRSEVAEELARRRQFRPYICMRGHVPREEALVAQQDAHLLLLLESGDPKVKGILTGKIFEYIASGTPVISLGSARGSAIDNLLRKTGCGICVQNDQPAIEAAILEAMKKRKPAWYIPCIEEILKYSRERQARFMFEQCVFPSQKNRKLYHR